MFICTTIDEEREGLETEVASDEQLRLAFLSIFL